MRIAVVGGGVAGLTAAYELAKAGHRVAVFEKWGRLGGAVYSWPLGPTRVEAFYHHLFTSDLFAQELLRELGLEGRLRWYDSKVGIFHGGRIYPFVTPLDLLRFRPLPPLDRVRLGLLGLYLRWQRDWRRWEGVTARDWVLRYGGRRIYEVVWGPLLQGKFGELAPEIGMAWFWGKVFVRFASRSGLLQREKLGYISGSFSTLTDALAERIRAMGGTLHVGRPVRRVLVEQGRVAALEVVEGRRAQREYEEEPSLAGPGELFPCEAVVWTAPSYELLRAVPELDGPYAAKLRAQRYQTAVVLVLVLRRSLTPVYWLNISDPEMPFVAAIEHTNMVPAEEYGGRHVLYLSNYVAPGHPLTRLRAGEVLERYLPALRRLNPAFDPSWIERRYLFKEEAAQPVIGVGYGGRIPEHRTPIPGLYLANTTQIYPEDRGTNYSIRLGKTVARLVMEDARESAVVATGAEGSTARALAKGRRWLGGK